MLTERDLLETIDECKSVKHPTASTCQLMASCYTIIDHLRGEASRHTASAQTYSFAPLPDNGGSEFAIVARQAEMSKLLDVIDAHMECVRALYPKEYAAIIRALQK